MAFAYSTAVAAAGTVSCTGTTTVTGVGTSFAFGFGSVPTGSQARVGGTITVGANTRTIVAIASATSLTVDTAFPTFTSQAFTVQTGVIQTGTDTMNLSLGSATGFLITNRGDLYRTFDCRGLDLTINGTLTVSSSVAQLRNDGSCNNRLTINGSVSGGELIFNGRISTAGNGPIPYAGLDWLGTNGMGGATALVSTNATYPAKLTLIDACIRFGGDWFTVSSGNFARITTQGDECWILCAKGTGTVQARIRLNNTTPVIDLQATQTWIGTWLNFGVPQISLKGFTPIFTDGPEINLSSVSVATRIDIENYDTRYIQSAYYPGSQIVPYGGAWIRFKNNLLGTNIVWQSLNVGGANYNVIEYSKQIKAISKDALGNVLNDGYFYFQPVGANVSGIRAKGGTSNITFDLTAKTLPISGGFATTEFVYAWDYANTTGLHNTPDYFCSVTTKGAETHPAFLSRYGYDKQPITLSLSGNNTFEVTASHSSLPTSSKVIATAQAITGIAFNFTTKVMTITGNLTYQQIYDAYQYALNTTANLFQADNCLTANATSDYVGWTINVGTGVTLSTGSGNFTKLKANTITLTGTAQITGVYSDTTGTSTVLIISGFGANSAVYVEDNNAVQKYFNADVTGSVVVYIPPTATGSWYYAVEKYGNQRQSDFFTFSGGQKLITVKELPDTGITQSVKATVVAYSELENPDKIYDYVAYLRLSVPHIGYGQIVFKNGQSLDLQDSGMLVNQSATNLASFNFNTKLLTIKSTSLESGTTYNKIIAIPPKTVIANTNEVITVEIEDANGDSSINIQGGSGSFSIFKFPIATTAYPSAGIDDRISPTNLITSTAGNGKFRFLADPLFNYVVLDNSQGNKANIPKENVDTQTWNVLTKGAYVAGLLQGSEQIALAQVNEVYEVLSKVNILLLDTDAIKGTGFTKDIHSLKNIKEFVDTIPADVWENAERTLTSAGSSGATLAEIEGSLILAKKAQLDTIQTKTDKMQFNAQNHIASNVHQLQAGAISDIQEGLSLESTSEEIKTKVLTLENYDDSITQNKLDTLQTDSDIIESTLYAIQSQQNDIAGIQESMLLGIQSANNNFDPVTDSLSALSDKLDLKPSLSEIEASDVLAKEDSVQEVLTKVNTLENYDDSVLEGKIDLIKIKTDTLENYDDSLTQSKLDSIQNTVENIPSDFTPILDAIDLLPTLSEIESGKVGDIKIKVDSLENYDDSIIEGKIDQIKTKVDTLENTDISNLPTLSEIEASDVLAKEDSVQEIIQQSPSNESIKEELRPLLVKMNEGIKKASRISTWKENLPE